MDDASTPHLLRALRVTLHVSFAGLLLLGSLRALVGALAPRSGHVTSVLVLAAALATVYLVGTVWENRFSRRRTTQDPRPLARPWLALITVLWGGLTLLSPDFSWVVFPLFFVYLVLLPRAAALLSIAALTAVVVSTQYVHAAPGGFSAAMVAGPAVGALFAIVVGHGYRTLYRDAEQHRRTVRDLRGAQAELAHREREVGRAGERERLSREIHDTLAQGLSSIVLMCRAAQQALADGGTGTAGDRLDVIEDTAVANLAEARRFVRDLTSPALDADLPTALRELCADTAARAHAVGQELTCQFHDEGTLPPMPQQHRSVLLRAAQASLANVAAHSRARTAVVTLVGWPEAVSLDVFDDGAGFDPDALRHHDDGQFGLTSLRARVQELHGTVGVESAPGDGTVVAVRIPVPAPPGDGR